jgi:hypothetical protein
MPRYPATKVPLSCENISIELAQQVLSESWGNIAQAADALGVPSRDFRFLVRTTPALTAIVDEASELYCDKAESILRDALESENELRRDVASRFVAQACPIRVAPTSSSLAPSAVRYSVKSSRLMNARRPWSLRTIFMPRIPSAFASKFNVPVTTFNSRVLRSALRIAEVDPVFGTGG